MSTSKSSTTPGPAALAHPRYWPTWLALALLRALMPMPFPVLLGLGRSLGSLAAWLPLRFARIARRNLELCLPERTPAERELLLREHLRRVGIAIFETAISWWSADGRILKLTRLEGEEDLRAALARGHGAILLSAHFTTLEIGARALF